MEANNKILLVEKNHGHWRDKLYLEILGMESFNLIHEVSRIGVATQKAILLSNMDLINIMEKIQGLDELKRFRKVNHA